MISNTFLMALGISSLRYDSVHIFKFKFISSVRNMYHCSDQSCITIVFQIPTQTPQRDVIILDQGKIVVLLLYYSGCPGLAIHMNTVSVVSLHQSEPNKLLYLVNELKGAPNLRRYSVQFLG
jgi:hypothetical protein